MNLRWGDIDVEVCVEDGVGWQVELDGLGAVKDLTAAAKEVKLIKIVEPNEEWLFDGERWRTDSCNHGEQEECGLCWGGPPYDIKRELFIDEVARECGVARPEAARVVDYLDKHFVWYNRVSDLDTD